MAGCKSASKLPLDLSIPAGYDLNEESTTARAEQEQRAASAGSSGGGTFLMIDVVGHREDGQGGTENSTHGPGGFDDIFVRGGVDAVRASLPPATSIMPRRESAAPTSLSEDPVLQVARCMQRVSDSTFWQKSTHGSSQGAAKRRITGESAACSAFCSRVCVF